MNYSEMDPAYVGAVVIQQCNYSIVICRFKSDFLIHFAFHARAVSFFVPGEKRFVGVIHMSANSDRTFRHQTLFAGFFTANIMEHAIPVSNDRVRYNLLVAGVMFRRGARQKEVIAAREKSSEISLWLEAQSLKSPEFVEQATFDYENVFFGQRHSLVVSE